MPTPTSPNDYLEGLPEDARTALAAVRKVILENLPEGFEEAIQYGMLAYQIPLSRYPKTYNGQPLTLAGLASRKGHMTLHLMSIYGDSKLREWFETAYATKGKKLDLGKACVRFKSLDALPLDVVGEAIAKVGVDDFIAAYERSRAETTKSTARSKKSLSPKKRTPLRNT
jgi:hypothetical protein